MQELMKEKQWLCWNYATKKDGKPTKVPCTIEGRPTGTTLKYQDTWVTYDRAARAAHNYSGTGFVLPAGVFLLDLDDRDVNDPLAKELLERFHTYAETSVSGHGIHIIGRCDLSRIPWDRSKPDKLCLSPEYYQKNPSLKMELYIGGSTNRYSTYSGHVIHDLPIEDCTEAILDTLEQYMRRSSAVPAGSILPAGNPCEDRDEEELEAEAFDIIAALRKQANKEKFESLFDDGMIPDGKSASEADMALCSLIAFRTGNDPELIDFIFRKSALYRDDKWERDDYREGTIRKAILLCAGEFHPSALTHPPFIRFKGKKMEPVVVPALLAQYIRETIPFLLVQNNSKQMTQFFVYENGRYVLCDKRKIEGIIKKPIEDYNIEMVSMNKVQEVYNQLLSDRDSVQIKELNADEHLINFQDGLLKVSPTEVELLEHTPDIKSTIQIPCAWQAEDTETPVFDAYLDRLTNYDPQVRQLLLEFVGICFSNVQVWRTKKALFLVGPGDTGKSILKSLVEMILGDENCISMDLQEIEARFGTGNLYGARLAGSSDMSNLAVNEMKILKKLTGGDMLFAELKGQQGFGFRYTGALWFCMNRLPKFGGDDGRWVYNRLLIVQCNNVIPKEEQDKELLDKLFAERAGIIKKAVRALQDVMQNGYRFTEPECVIRAREEYKKENNTAIAFFTECMCERKDPKRDPYHKVTYVYEAYLYYCRKNGYKYPKRRIEFRDAIMEYLNITDPKQLADHCKVGTCYLHYMLTEEAMNEYGGLAA